MRTLRLLKAQRWQGMLKAVDDLGKCAGQNRKDGNHIIYRYNPLIQLQVHPKKGSKIRIFRIDLLFAKSAEASRFSMLKKSP